MDSVSHRRDKVSFPLYIDKQMLKLIEDYQYKHYLRLTSRNSAVVELIMRGLTESVVSDSNRFDKLMNTYEEAEENKEKDDE
jgi:hypothetical protein